MKKNRIVALALSIVMVASLAACGGGGTTTAPSANGGTTPEGTTSGAVEGTTTPTASGKVYFQNFKPEQGEAYKEIAAKYTAETGVEVKVETAAAGTYEQTLLSEMAKSDAPTIFQINGPVGYANWKAYTADLSGSTLYEHLSDKSLAIKEGDGVYAIPFAIEGYGIIVNTAIMDKYFALDGAKATSLAEINTFAKLKEVVEDMTAKKADLEIEGVFANTSLKPGEDWRWQTHLMNIPMYYEWQDSGADLSDPAATNEITFKYNENFKNIFDLYLNNSTVEPSLTGAKTVNDSMAEFALGQAAMVQNGNWAYGQVSGVEGNVVKPEDVSFLPIYIGVTGEETQGIAIGTENFFCINKNSPAEDQQASLDFLAWLYTTDEGKKIVTNDLGFIAPFDTFTDADKPSDPLGQQVMEWNAKADIKNVPWNFTVFPSQQFKNNFGGYLLQYAQGQMQWADVASSVVADWATEKAASAQ